MFQGAVFTTTRQYSVYVTAGVRRARAVREVSGQRPATELSHQQTRPSIKDEIFIRLDQIIIYVIKNRTELQEAVLTA